MSLLSILAVAELATALVVWTIALWGITVSQEYILQWLFFFAWYPYILFLDGMLFRLQGKSWLISRPLDLLRILFWSVTVWLIFEALNLSLKNWGYVGVTSLWWLRWPYYALAFATVLPGILLTAQVLSALGAWAGFRGPPRNPGVLATSCPPGGHGLSDPPRGFPQICLPPGMGRVFLFAGPLLRPPGRGIPDQTLDRGRTPGTPLPPYGGPDLRPLVGIVELPRGLQVGLHPAGFSFREDFRDARLGLSGVPAFCPGVRGDV